MRVLVELFDRDAIKNVLGPCVFTPEIVVFLCDTRDATFFKESAIYRLFKRRKMKTMPRFYYFDATSPDEIRRVLAAVIRDYPGCVFDFSGGSDLVLLLAGASFAEGHAPGYYIDMQSGRLIDLRGCAGLAEGFRMPEFSAEDIFVMTGATIQGHGHFPQQMMDDGLEQDALAVFEMVLESPRAWGNFVAWLQAFCAGWPAKALELEGPRLLRAGESPLHANTALLRRLHAAGLLEALEIGHGQVSLRFKSLWHRKCLLIEGIWLELFCYVAARRGGFFDDVRTSIVVDWDGVEGGNENTKNEVDVFLLRGITPVFVSCKMSVPTALAMSEIKLLSVRFGGGMSRAVLLTAAALGDEHKALKTRAAELDIALLDRSACTLEALGQALQAIAEGRRV